MVFHKTFVVTSDGGVQILVDRSPGRLDLFTVTPNICGPRSMEFPSCHLSEARNFEVACRILENFLHPWAKVLNLVLCVVCGFVRPVNEKGHTHTHILLVLRPTMIKQTPFASGNNDRLSSSINGYTFIFRKHELTTECVVIWHGITRNE